MTYQRPVPPAQAAAAAPKPKGRGLGIAALVLGIVSVVLCWVPVVNILFIICGVVGAILGIIGIFISHRVLSIVGTVLGIVGIVLGIAVNASFASSVSDAVDNAAPPAVQNAPAQQSSDSAPVPVGKPGVDGSMSFTVTGVSTAHTLGSGPLATTAHGKYLIVGLSVHNISKKSATFLASSQTATDAAGNQYQTSSDAVFSGNQADENSFLQTINPGNTVQGRLVFDVPSDAKPTAVTLHGSIGTDGVVMALH